MESNSRASQAAFAYSDQLKSPNLGMGGFATGSSGSEGTELGKPTPSTAGDVSAIMNLETDSAENSPVKGRGGKKTNPLQDLIETETAYVAELGKIIRVSVLLSRRISKAGLL